MKTAYFLFFAGVLLLCLFGPSVGQSCDPSVEECPVEGTAEEVKRPPRKSAVIRYPIQHALGTETTNDGFLGRGEIEVSASKKTKKISIKFSQKSYQLSKTEVDAFETLVKSGGFYRIRIPVDASSTDGPWLYASVRACLMVEQGFKESFRFHLDKSGKITSIELQPLSEKSSCSGEAVSLPKQITIRSKASAALPREAHVAKSEVLAQSSLKKSNIPAELQQDLGSGGLNTKKDDDKDKDGEEETQTSFVRKYWYIFLPMFLASIAGGGGAEPQGKKK